MHQDSQLQFRTPLGRLKGRLIPPLGSLHIEAKVPGGFDVDGFCRMAVPLLEEGFPEHRWDHDSIVDRVLAPATLRRVLVGLEGDVLAGFTTIHQTAEPGVAKLHWLAVAEPFRRRGLGVALVLMAAREAWVNGFSVLSLKTETYRVPAIALYRQLGFQESFV